MAETAHKTLVQNRKARHDFFIDEVFEAGLALCGTEVKSIRQGNVNLKDCYATVRGGEVFVIGMHISPYEKGNIFNKDPIRDRKLLLHKAEISRLLGYVKQKGFSLIPLELYLKRGMVKMALGVARGKKLYDKRADLAEKEGKREVERAFKDSQRV